VARTHGSKRELQNISRNPRPHTQSRHWWCLADALIGPTRATARFNHAAGRTTQTPDSTEADDDEFVHRRTRQCLGPRRHGRAAGDAGQRRQHRAEQWARAGVHARQHAGDPREKRLRPGAAHGDAEPLLTGSPLPAARAATPPLTTSWAEDESEVPAREQQAWGGEEGYSHAEGLDEAEYLLAPGVGLPRTLFEDGRPRPHVEGEPNLTRLGTPGTTRFAFPPYPQCRSCRRNCVSGDDAPPCTIAPTRCRTTQPPRQPRSSIRCHVARGGHCDRMRTMHRMCVSLGFGTADRGATATRTPLRFSIRPSPTVGCVAGCAAGYESRSRIAR
jgi:hypothetical protein